MIKIIMKTTQNEFNIYLKVDSELHIIASYNNPKDAINRVKLLKNAIPFAKTEVI